MRELIFTEEAIKDMLWIKITPKEWDAIRDEMERLCRSRSVRADTLVCKIIQCDRQWYRLRVSRPSEIRVFFSIDGFDEDIIVRAVLRRTDRTYDIAEILYRRRR